jgi:hypothetical protein
MRWKHEAPIESISDYMHGFSFIFFLKRHLDHHGDECNETLQHAMLPITDASSSNVEMRQGFSIRTKRQSQRAHEGLHNLHEKTPRAPGCECNTANHCLQRVR